MVFLFQVSMRKSAAVSFETDQAMSMARISDVAKIDLFKTKFGVNVKDYASARPNIIAAINDGFFDTRNVEIVKSGKKSSIKVYAPTGLTVIGGNIEAPLAGSRQDDKSQREAKWYAVFYVDKKGKANIMKSDEFASHFKNDLSTIRVAVECGPIIVRNSQAEIIMPDGYKGFVENKKVRRAAVGVDNDGNVILLCTKKPLDLHQLSKMMIDKGAVVAMNLDGGPSAGFGCQLGKGYNIDNPNNVSVLITLVSR